MALNNFVKFMRGSKVAYDKLQNKNLDTLYFITTYSDGTSGDIQKTELYWGDRLLSDGCDKETSSVIQKLTELNDVSIDATTLADGMYLAYDENSQKWVAQDFPEITIPEIDDIVDKINALIGEEDEGLTIRQIAAEEVAAIVDSAPEAYDTLNEIAQWIINNPGSVTALNAKVGKLEDLLGYTPEDTENGLPASLQAIDKVDAFAKSLADNLGAQYNEDGSIASLQVIEKIKVNLGITEDDDGNIVINSAPVGKLEDLLLKDEADTLVDAINLLTQQMQWEEITNN